MNVADCRMYHAAKEAPGHHFCGGLWTAARAALDRAVGGLTAVLGSSKSPGLQKTQA